jgi:hypothetical protein
MKNLNNRNDGDDSSNGDETKATGAPNPTKSAALNKDHGHLFSRKSADSILVDLNELRNIRAVAEDNDIIDLPDVSWIPRFDQDIARMYGEELTAKKTNDSTTYMWIQDSALMKQYQEWLPKAYDLIFEKDLMTQLLERAENLYKTKGTAWDHPKLKNGKPKKVAEYSESEREAHEKFKALQKLSINPDGDGIVRIPTLKSFMEEWRRRDLASGGSDYVEICEPGHPGYSAALAHRWIDLAAEDTESRGRRTRDVKSGAFELMVRRLDSLLVQEKQRPGNEKSVLPAMVQPDYSVYDFILSADKHEMDELVREFDRKHGAANKGLIGVDMDLDIAMDTDINVSENYHFSPHPPMGPAVEMAQKATELEHCEVNGLNEVNMRLDTDTNASESRHSSTDILVDSVVKIAQKVTKPEHSEIAPVPQATTTQPPFIPKLGCETIAHLKDCSWLYE